MTRTDPAHYFLYMLSTLLVLCAVLVGLLVLLALIVSLSARPATVARSSATGRTETWVPEARQHSEAWAPLSTTTPTSELPAAR